MAPRNGGYFYALFLIKTMQSFFHASPRRLPVGTVLEPQAHKNFEFSSDWVYLTTSENPHHTVRDRVLAEGWHVYEVLPLGEIRYGSMWAEALTPKAKIIRYVGNARGLALKNKRGSWVNPRTLPAKTKGRGSYRACLRNLDVVDFDRPSPAGLRLQTLRRSFVVVDDRMRLYDRLGIPRPKWM